VKEELNKALNAIDFIERWFGFSPDGGYVEIALIVLVVMAIVLVRLSFASCERSS